jgi:hypothetical protein
MSGLDKDGTRHAPGPFDLAAELHLKFDTVAVAYRKAMRALGLATSAPARTAGVPEG